MTNTEILLAVIAALLFFILLAVERIASRLKEKFPTDKEEDRKWAQKTPRTELNSEEASQLKTTELDQRKREKPAARNCGVGFFHQRDRLLSPEIRLNELHARLVRNSHETTVRHGLPRKGIHQPGSAHSYQQEQQKGPCGVFESLRDCSTRQAAKRQ